MVRLKAEEEPQYMAWDGHRSGGRPWKGPQSGAALTTTNTLKHALILVEHDGLSGAILDHALGDGNSSLLCRVSRSAAYPS